MKPVSGTLHTRARRTGPAARGGGGRGRPHSCSQPVARRSRGRILEALGSGTQEPRETKAFSHRAEPQRRELLGADVDIPKYSCHK